MENKVQKNEKGKEGEKKDVFKIQIQTKVMKQGEGTKQGE